MAQLAARLVDSRDLGGFTRIRLRRRAHRGAVGLLGQRGIDHDLAVERAGQRRILVVGDEAVVERVDLLPVRMAAGEQRRGGDSERNGAAERHRHFPFGAQDSRPKR